MIRPRTETVVQRLGEELVLVNLETNRMFVGNTTAVEIWESLQRGEHLDSIKQRLVESSGTTTASSDVDRFIEELLREGFLEEA